MGSKDSNDLLEIDFFKDIYQSYQKKIKSINNEILIYQIIRDSINFMVKDLIKNTMINLKSKKIKSIQNIYSCENQIVCFSNKFLKIEQEIKHFLRSRMYDNKNVIVKNNKGKRFVKNLFDIV